MLVIGEMLSAWLVLLMYEPVTHDFFDNPFLGKRRYRQETGHNRYDGEPQVLTHARLSYLLAINAIRRLPRENFACFESLFCVFVF